MVPRIQLLAAASMVHLLATVSASGDDTFTLSVAPTRLPFVLGKAGEDVAFSCQALLGHVGTGPGAGAWSLGIAADGAAITSATFGGTHAGQFVDLAGSLERIHIVDPAENGGVSGVVSNIVLSTGGLETAVLPPRSSWSILSLDLRGTIPGGGGSAKLECRGGLVAQGETFPLSVTQGGTEVVPEVLPALEVALHDSSDCCEHPVNLGFSAAVIKDGPVFEGISGAGEKCLAAGGEIIAEAPLGEVNSTTVHVNIISNITDSDNQFETVQGWTIGVAVDGSAEIRSITRAGTSADTVPNGGYLGSSPLGKIMIIDPAKNGGQNGVLDSAVLSLTGEPEAVMPPVGTQTVLEIVLAAAEPQRDADQTATLRFQNGLVGSGTPTTILLTVNGQAVVPCNMDSAGVTVVFRRRPDVPFRRGDSNNDEKVDISDAVATLNFLFMGGVRPTCRDSADANDSGLLDISDAVYVLNFLFAGAVRPPPAPGPEACGSDPTEEDSLDCLESSCPRGE